MQRAGRDHCGGGNKKLTEAARWLYGDGYRYFSEVCREWARREHKEIFCETCEDNKNCNHRKPRIIGGNRRIWELLQLCGNQWRTGVGGPVGLDFGVAITIAQAMGIETGQTFFEKLAVYESTALVEMRMRQKNEDPKR